MPLSQEQYRLLIVTCCWKGHLAASNFKTDKGINRQRGVLQRLRLGQLQHSRCLVVERVRVQRQWLEGVYSMLSRKYIVETHAAQYVCSCR